MEGLLKVFIKRTFSLSTFDQFWVVLDFQNLSYYDGIKIATDTVGPFKDAILIKNAKILKLRPKENGTKFGIKIVSDTGSQLALLDCDDADSWNSWFNALTKAVTMHVEQEERNQLPKKCRELLRIDPTITALSKSLISRSYKKLALQLHPDKGGDVDMFNKVNQAYNSLMALQTVEDERSNSDPIDYEVVIEKGPARLGLGIVVQEDKARQQIVVQAVQEGVLVRGISAESGGSIKPGDILIGIGKDDCSHWLLSRVRARLGPLRVPVGSTILLSFERRVPRQVEPEAATPQTSFKLDKDRDAELNADFDTSQAKAESGPMPPPFESPGPGDRKAAVDDSGTENESRGSRSRQSKSRQSKYNDEDVDYSLSMPPVVPPSSERPRSESQQPPSSPVDIKPESDGDSGKSPHTPYGNAGFDIKQSTSSTIDRAIYSELKREFDFLKYAHEKLKHQHSGVQQIVASLEAENESLRRAAATATEALVKEQATSQRQMLAAFQAADSAKQEAREMRDRANSLISLLHDKVVSITKEEDPTMPPSQQLDSLDLVGQVRRLNVQVVELTMKLSEAARVKREQDHLVMQLRTSLRDKSRVVDVENKLRDRDSSSFTSAFVMKKASKLSEVERRTESVADELRLLLREANARFGVGEGTKQ